MPLDFPTSPTNGQVYDQWQWDGAKWVAIVGTLPAGPAGPTGPQGIPGAGSVSGMTAGQIPIAASATAISSSANLSGDVTSNATLATTLATVNSNVGTFQGITLDAKGRVTAAANQSYVTGGPYLPTAGGVLTGSITLTPNNVAAVKGVEVGGTPRNLIFMGSDNTVYVGEGANSIQLWATALSTTSHLDLSNNNSLRGKDTGGIARQLTTLAADNVIYLGDGARTIVTNCGAGNQLFNTGAASKPGGGVWSDSSDARLKKNVVDYGRGLAAVVQLRPVYFEFNGLADTPTDGKTFVGLVADEVEPVMPEMVGTRSALLHPEDEEPVDVKTLDCTALLFALVNSARELADRVAELEARMPPGLPIIDERH